MMEKFYKKLFYEKNIFLGESVLKMLKINHHFFVWTTKLMRLKINLKKNFKSFEKMFFYNRVTL